MGDDFKCRYRRQYLPVKWADAPDEKSCSAEKSASTRPGGDFIYIWWAHERLSGLLAYGDAFIRLRRIPRACPWMNAKNNLVATARCHPKEKEDNRGVAEGEDGYLNGTTGLPVGRRFKRDNFFRYFRVYNPIRSQRLGWIPWLLPYCGPLSPVV